MRKDDVKLPVLARTWVRPWRLLGLAFGGAALAVGALIVIVSCAPSLGHTVGSTVSNDWVIITLVSVTEPAPEPDISVAPDHRLVVAHIRFANHGNSQLNFNEVQFRIHDSQGNLYSPGAGTYFPYGGRAAGHAVAPGESVESDIVFVLPRTIQGAQLRFEPDGLRDISNFWWTLGV